MSVSFTNYYCISSTFSGTALSICRRQDECDGSSSANPSRPALHPHVRQLLRLGVRDTELSQTGKRLRGSPGARVRQAGGQNKGLQPQ